MEGFKGKPKEDHHFWGFPSLQTHRCLQWLLSTPTHMEPEPELGMSEKKKKRSRLVLLYRGQNPIRGFHRRYQQAMPAQAPRNQASAWAASASWTPAPPPPPRRSGGPRPGSKARRLRGATRGRVVFSCFGGTKPFGWF